MSLHASRGTYTADLQGVRLEDESPALLAAAIDSVLADVEPTQLEIHAADSAALVWWERLLAAPGATIVRPSSAIPAVHSIPLTPPIRFLALDGAELSSQVEELAARLGQPESDGPLLAWRASPAGDDALDLISRRWATADILYIGMATGEGGEWSPRLGAPGLSRSLGWLERLVRAAQTRLVVLAAEDGRHHEVLRVAGRLVERGGPAVVVVPDEFGVVPLIGRLLTGADLARALSAEPGAAAFVGQGRERLLQLMPTVQEIEAGDDDLAFGWATRRETAGEAAASIAEVLRAMRHRERGPRPETPDTTAPRHVNLDLLRADGQARLEQIPPKGGAPLPADVPFVLRVAIGPVDVQAPVFRRQALVEEVIVWDPADGGAWLTVGIAGVHCEFDGAPDQPIWLPRQGSTQPCYFRIRPWYGGFVALRVTLYQGNSVLQSFRLIARTEDGTRGPADDEVFAAALGESTDVAGLVWASRLDFALTPALEPSEVVPRRALSLVVNDLAETVVVTVKTDELFTARTEGPVWLYVGLARAALGWWSERAGYYLFGGDGDLTDRLKSSLRDLAVQGRALRHQVLPLDSAQRHEIEQVVLGSLDEVIQVAHVVRHQVVPWSLLYEFELDPGMEEIGGRPAVHEVCLAALPGADGTMPYTTCGQPPGCLLAPDGRGPMEAVDAKGLLERRTVVCPLGFWGFRHTIEMPPKPVRDGSSAPAWRQVEGGSPVRAAAGFNPNLPGVSCQADALRALLSDGQPISLVTPQTRDAIIEALSETDLQVVYLYCHAAGEPLPPFLEFANRTGKAATINAEALTADEAHRWVRHPLVILNACRTAAFDPAAMSPFIETLIENRWASGVIGTEVSVHEDLAAAVGPRLVAAFLRGEEMGPALLNERRRLLAARNPLGLTYTLYGVADLHIATAGTQPVPTGPD